MTGTTPPDDPWTVAALAVAAMIVVTLAHEAVGHGSACWAAGGHVLVITSTVFRCTARSPWIALAGPLANLLVAAGAAGMLRLVSPGALRLRLHLVMIAGLGAFWEAGYVIEAMRSRHGDLYSVAEALIADPGIAVRVPCALLGAGLYAVVVPWLSRELSRLRADPRRARRNARLCWFAASSAAAIAALACSRDRGPAVRDALLEIGAASWPLLTVPRRAPAAALRPATPRIASDPWLVAAVAALYALFVAGPGRGLYWD